MPPTPRTITGTSAGTTARENELELLGPHQDVDRSGRHRRDEVDLAERRGCPPAVRAGRRRNEVGVTDEGRHPPRHGTEVEVGRLADLFDAAGRDHRHLVAEHEGLVLVVGHEDRGDAEADQQLVDLGSHLRSQRGVEVREGLVEQEDRGPRRDGAGEGHTLAAARRTGS